jgi:hypothetical protein
LLCILIQNCMVYINADDSEGPGAAALGRLALLVIEMAAGDTTVGFTP